VKRSGAFINSNPITINLNDTYKTVKERMIAYNVKSFLVINEEKSESDDNLSPKLKIKKRKTLYGILTNRDITNFEFDDQLVK
jgi:CBS domain-containing protein